MILEQQRQRAQQAYQHKLQTYIWLSVTVLMYSTYLMIYTVNLVALTP
jgi:hypothetical protein